MTKQAISSEKKYNDRYAGDYMDSDDYSTWARADLRTQQVVEMLESMPISPNKLLDYGCGVGGWIPVLARVFPKAEIHGVEISSTALEKAQIKFPRFHFHHLENNSAPLPDESFDMVFSYHVLEHVDDFRFSVKDIARLLTNGGYACISFPCGNPGSFLDRSMTLVRESKHVSQTGEKAYFFEIPDGHVRRLTSDETIGYFKESGLKLRAQKFSGHFWGTLDWLCRGTGPAYINRVFSGQPAKNKLARLKLEIIRKSLLAMHRFLRFQYKDLSIKRNPTKHFLLWGLKNSALLFDRSIIGLSSLEWRIFKKRKSGTAQYLIFEKV